MRSVTTILVLALLSPSAFAGVIPFSDPRRTGPAGFNQYGMLASNGTDYLAAWTTSGAAQYHVYATQVRADGTVPNAVATQLDAGTSAKAAWGVSISAGRDGYFATWLTPDGVTFAALDSYGRVERTSSIKASTYGGTSTAWDGTTHLVLYGVEGGGSKGVLVDDNANVIAAGIDVSTPVDGTTAVTPLANGDGFLVLKYAPGDPLGIFARRVYPSGTTDPWVQVRTVASPVASIAAVYDGTHVVITWADWYGIWNAELDPKTNALGTSRQIVTASQSRVRTTELAGQTWIIWSESQQGTPMTSATPLSADGTPGARSVIGRGYFPDIATNGRSILSIRSMERDPAMGGNTDEIGQFVTPAGSDFVVSKSQTDQEDGGVASDGTTVLAVWDEEIGAGQEIFAGRHRLASAAPDGAGVQISSGGINTLPAAASNGTTWLIAWLRRASSNSTTAVVVARRFSADGRVIDTEDIVVGPALSWNNRLRVASDGSSWMVAWLATRPGDGCNRGQSTMRLMLARISAKGVVLDPGGVDIGSSNALNTTDLDLAWNGSRYVAAALSNCSYFGHSMTTYNVSGAFISPDLTRVEFAPVSGAFDAGSVWTPRITANATAALIAWEHSGNTEYAVVPNSSGPKPARSRAVSAPRAIQSLVGWLVGVCPAATGQMMILTAKKIPWAANNGVFFSIIDANGTVIGTGLTAILDGSEGFTGYVARQGAYAWIADTQFDPAGGANREWMWPVDSPH